MHLASAQAEQTGGAIWVVLEFLLLLFQDKRMNKHMPTATVQKLRIKEGNTILTVNAPANYEKSLGETPKDVSIIESGKNFDQLHWFVKDRSSMEKGLKKILSLVKGSTICWIFYPKGTSGIQTDLNRDSGWEELLKHDMQWISLISFDETWSAFGMREKTEKDRAKEAKPKERPVFDYVDPKTKTVSLPDDLAAAFKKNKQQFDYFNTLAFSHKKEYIEWIVTAKKEETRKQRVAGTIERLGRGLKNPAGR